MQWEKQYPETRNGKLVANMAITFANIFMAKVETDIIDIIISPCLQRQLHWKRYINDVVKEKIGLKSK